MKTVEVITDKGHMDTIVGLAEQYDAVDCWLGSEGEDGRQSIRLLIKTDVIQTVLDRLQSLLGGTENSHIIVQATEVVLPKVGEAEKDEGEARKKKATYREEIYNAIANETKFNSHYFALVVLSTLVAAIGLVENNVAVIIGAMVIAPLLGPNLAFGLATALGDRELAGQSFMSIVLGLLLAIGLSFLLGLVWPPALNSPELMSRTTVGLDSIALALASGAAAVMSLTSGVSSVLVGVMVAVALLPPAATVGLMLSVGHVNLAEGAALLLAVNIVSVNLAAKLVFLIKGVRPRTWLEQKKAKQSMWLYVLLWLVTLAILVWAILTEQVV
jgi:uncharacterized hydrophobic protein (TIGR00341 family)